MKSWDYYAVAKTMFFCNSPSTKTSRDMTNCKNFTRASQSPSSLSRYIYIQYIYIYLHMCVHIHTHIFIHTFLTVNPCKSYGFGLVVPWHDLWPRNSRLGWPFLVDRFGPLRYRKEKTGSMSEDDLRRVEREICRVKDLEKRRSCAIARHGDAPGGSPQCWKRMGLTWVE